MDMEAIGVPNSEANLFERVFLKESKSLDCALEIGKRLCITYPPGWWILAAAFEGREIPVKRIHSSSQIWADACGCDPFPDLLNVNQAIRPVMMTSPASTSSVHTSGLRSGWARRACNTSSPTMPR